MIFAAETSPPDKVVTLQKPQPLFQGSLHNQADRQVAVAHIQKPGALLISTLRTFGLWFNGQDSLALQNSFTIKGETAELGRTRSIMGFMSDFVDFIDHEAIHPDLRALTSNSQRFQETMGAMAFARLPIKPGAITKIPAGLRSPAQANGRSYIHLLDPTGHEGMSSLINELNAAGITFVGVTSLNKKNQPEIRDQVEAIEFGQTTTTHSLAILTDPHQQKHDFTGSYTIFDFESKKVIRLGQIQLPLLEHILGTRFDASEAKAAKFENSSELSRKLIHEYGLTRQEVRTFILAYTNGAPDGDIKRLND